MCSKYGKQKLTLGIYIAGISSNTIQFMEVNMITQGFSNISAAYSPKNLSSQRQSPISTTANFTDSAASSSSTVTISQAAHDLATTQPSSNPYLRFRAIVLQDAKDDPAFAKKMAEQLAYDDSYELHGPLVDISHDPIRYSATGEVVTEENLAAFKAEAAKVTAGRISLYQAEKAKGTPDAQILGKLFAFVDGQSDNYLSKLNWARPPQQNAVEYAATHHSTGLAR